MERQSRWRSGHGEDPRYLHCISIPDIATWIFDTYRPWQCNERHFHPNVAERSQYLALCDRVDGCCAYSDLENELVALVLGGKGVENWRKLLSVELDYPLYQLLFFLSISVRPIACRRAMQSWRRSRALEKGFFVLSTTAPMTWWTFPSFAESELANLWEKTGAKDGLMALRTAGLNVEALKERAMPLDRKSAYCEPQWCQWRWILPSEHFDMTWRLMGVEMKGWSRELYVA